MKYVSSSSTENKKSQSVGEIMIEETNTYIVSDLQIVGVGRSVEF